MGPSGPWPVVHFHVARGAETFNFVSHLLGTVSGIVGMLWLQRAASSSTEHVAFAIYSASLILLFSASAAHHAIQSASGRERDGWSRRLDHVSIYLFIAGTYTPFCLLALPASSGQPLLIVVASLALVGVALKMFAPFTPRWLTTSLYIALGWSAIFTVGPLLERFAPSELAWVLAGGVAYTVGAVGYATQKPDLWPQHVGFHGVWHVSVLVGAACHFVFVTRFLA
jgi:hemolysin III